MLLARSTELAQLNQYYERESSCIVVVYGQRGFGRTALLKEFIENKPSIIYRARACSEREQVYLWNREIAKSVSDNPYPAYSDILSRLLAKSPAQRKQVLVIDEFQYLLKGGNAFMDSLLFVLRQSNKPLLVILTSSQVGWVENSMITKMGPAASSLAGFLKLKELKFSDCRRYFKRMSNRQCMEIYAILGGNPGLWRYMEDGVPTAENIIQHILANGLYLEAERLLTDELREPAVYNTILTSLAQGIHKLNDLYLHTGFSRAKISVYLKNLMELDIVEKVFSYEADGNENAQRGIYRIQNPFLHFYYRFIYPHKSALFSLSFDAFYVVSGMEDELDAYVEEYFTKICREQLFRLNENGYLPIHIRHSGEWIGKKGTIDFVAQDEAGHSLFMCADYRKNPLKYEDYEEILSLTELTKIKADYIYLYAMGHFDERLEKEAKKNKNLTLISLAEE